MPVNETPVIMPANDRKLIAILQQERSRLARFIRRRVSDPGAAEDILQDALSALIEAWHLPAPIEQAGAWLMQVARRRIIDRFRQQRELPLPDWADDAEDDWLASVLPDSREGPEAALARKRLLQALQAALEDLPAAQREVFVAHELEGEAFRDMAARTGVPLNTLLARKRYAVQALRSRLQDHRDQLEN